MTISCLDHECVSVGAVLIHEPSIAGAQDDAAHQFESKAQRQVYRILRAECRIWSVSSGKDLGCGFARELNFPGPRNIPGETQRNFIGELNHAVVDRLIDVPVSGIPIQTSHITQVSAEDAVKAELQVGRADRVR